jgi:Tfp pilus assembly protein PilP
VKFTHIALSFLVVVACLTGCKDDSTVVTNAPETSPSSEVAQTPAPAAPAPTAPAPVAETPDSTPSASETPPAAAITPPTNKTEIKPTVPGKANESPLTKMTPRQLKNFNTFMKSKDVEYKAILQIPKPKSENWEPVSVTAAAIAEDIQKSIPMLRNTIGQIQAVIKTPDGSGDVNQLLKIRDSKIYDVPFVLVGDRPAEAKIISNGNYKMEEVQARWQKTVKSADPMSPFLATGFAAAFERDFTQQIFSPITNVGPSWPSMVSHWSDPSQGYKITVEERSIQIYKDNPKLFYRDFRIHAVRSPEAAQRLGASEISVVVDGYHSLPVRIQTSYTDPTSKKSWEMTWAVSYHAGQKFKDKDFAAPYNQGGKSAPPTSS